jgi:hypothetical protein
MTTKTTDRVKPVDTLAFTALDDPRKAMDWVRGLLNERRPANVFEIGRTLLGYEMNETVAMMIAVARAHYLTLTAEPAVATQPEPQAPVTTPTPQPAQSHEVEGSGWDGEILDGIYTVEFENGDYRTLKVKTQDADANFKPGAKLISYLDGPDNWRNYRGFGEVLKGNQLWVWEKHRGATMIVKAALALLAGPEAMIDGAKAYGRKSKRCGICGKPLTTPESLDLGIGPICAARMGI